MTIINTVWGLVFSLFATPGIKFLNKNSSSLLLLRVYNDFTIPSPLFTSSMRPRLKADEVFYFFCFFIICFLLLLSISRLWFQFFFVNALLSCRGLETLTTSVFCVFISLIHSLTTFFRLAYRSRAQALQSIWVKIISSIINFLVQLAPKKKRSLFPASHNSTIIADERRRESVKRRRKKKFY